MGHSMKIVGLVSGARTWMTGMVFISLDALLTYHGTPRIASFIRRHSHPGSGRDRD